MSTTPKRAYHHGDLRAALIRTVWDLVDEEGVERFSLAAAARRTGVSPRAPYRHFANREALLVAAATEAASELARDLETAVAQRDGDPVEQLAAAAAAYVLYAQEHHAGFDVLFRAGLNGSGDEGLRTARRRIGDVLLPPAMALAPDPETGATLVESMVGLMHGFATLLRDGFLADRGADHSRYAARRVAAAARVLASGYVAR